MSNFFLCTFFVLKCFRGPRQPAKLNMRTVCCSQIFMRLIFAVHLPHEIILTCHTLHAPKHTLFDTVQKCKCWLLYISQISDDSVYPFAELNCLVGYQSFHTQGEKFQEQKLSQHLSRGIVPVELATCSIWIKGSASVSIPTIFFHCC